MIVRKQQLNIMHGLIVTKRSISYIVKDFSISKLMSTRLAISLYVYQRRITLIVADKLFSSQKTQKCDYKSFKRDIYDKAFELENLRVNASPASYLYKFLGYYVAEERK